MDNNNTTNKEQNIQNKDELIKEEKIFFGYKPNNNEYKPILQNIQFGLNNNNENIDIKKE